MNGIEGTTKPHGVVIRDINIVRHLACWQIVQGALGRWYRIEKHPDGHWLERAGPYRNRQEARECLKSEPLAEMSNWPSLMACDIAQSGKWWYVVVHVREGRWAQMAGPFRRRDGAREWLTEYEGEGTDSRDAILEALNSPAQVQMLKG